jgi:hypothetical protein
MRTRTLMMTVLMTLVVAAVAFPQDAEIKVDTDAKIAKGSRFFIGAIEGGYDIYLAAAMHKKEVPIVIVTDKSKADFELSGVTESEKAGWAKTIFLKNTSTAEQASIKVVNLKTGTVVFGYNVNKSSSARGKQSSAESCAKHLKEKIESGQ